MSTEQTQLTRLIPVAPDTDLPQLQWLVRESFETYADGLGLVVAAYSDEVVPTPTDLSQDDLDHLALPADQYQWHQFTATVVRGGPLPVPDRCPYCHHAPHRAKCGQAADNPDGLAVVPVCTCPGWPL